MNLDEAIKKYTPTETAEKLKQMLFDIWDDKEFVLGVLSDLKTDGVRKKMIKALENNLEDYEFDDNDWNEYTDKVYLTAEAIADGEI